MLPRENPYGCGPQSFKDCLSGTPQRTTWGTIRGPQRTSGHIVKRELQAEKIGVANSPCFCHIPECFVKRISREIEPSILKPRASRKRRVIFHRNAFFGRDLYRDTIIGKWWKPKICFIKTSTLCDPLSVRVSPMPFRPLRMLRSAVIFPTRLQGSWSYSGDSRSRSEEAWIC